MVDDAHILAASEDRTCTLWDIGAEKLQHIFRASMGAVRGVAMPDQVRAACELRAAGAGCCCMRQLCSTHHHQQH